MMRIQTYDGVLLLSTSTDAIPRRGDAIDVDGLIMKVDQVVFRTKTDTNSSFVDVFVIPHDERAPKIPQRRDTFAPLTKTEYLLDFGNNGDWYLFPIEEEANFLRWVETNTSYVPEEPLDCMIPVNGSEKVVITSYRLRD